MKNFSEHVWPEFAFFRYALKLNQPLELKFGRVDVRNGILVRCEKSGYCGWGDIAPLDGYSPETFDDVLCAIPDLQKHLLESKSLSHELPSIQCGLEFAYENWKAASQSRPLYLSLNGGSEKTHIPVARLIAGASRDEIAKNIKLAIKDGYSCIKLKVGALALDQDIQLVRKVQSDLPAGVMLRLDANRSWTLAEAVEFSKSISSAGIDFIEEPLNDYMEYDEYDRAQPLTFALDESLVNVKREQITEWKNLKAVVLKPTLLGGLGPTLDWMNWAQESSRQSIVSAAFESGVGIRNLIAVAGARAINTVAGLDTYSYLADDVVNPALQFRRGRVAIFQSFPKSWEINFDKLDRII